MANCFLVITTKTKKTPGEPESFKNPIFSDQTIIDDK